LSNHAKTHVKNGNDGGGNELDQKEGNGPCRNGGEKKRRGSALFDFQTFQAGMDPLFRRSPSWWWNSDFRRNEVELRWEIQEQRGGIPGVHID